MTAWPAASSIPPGSLQASWPMSIRTHEISPVKRACTDVGEIVAAA